ncbi:flagellar motor protein [Burkholderia guangdongensis]|uniref:flagellar motor protein n=1 Tax=Burkholderia guangdongensis TaxID=1792500 RepID=UPI0015C863C9|nr:flagellar motor protein [Burkholderia guangdongensis]
MDFLTIVGALVGVVAIGVGFWFEGGHFGALVQPQSLVIVLGGTLGAVMIQNSWACFADGVRQLGLAFSKPRQVDRAQLSVLLEWGDQAKLNGMLVFESIDANGVDAFARRGLELLADGVPTEVLKDALQRELEAIERNRMSAARIWLQAGGYAPTFGIVGAVIGLIQVTGHILDPERLGSGIAGAFTATLYGLALANLVFLPIHGKIKTRINSEQRYRRLYFDGLLAISRKESPTMIAARLAGEVRERSAELLK